MNSSNPEGPIEIVAVVPCYNPGDRVRPVVEGILEHIGKVIVVDDGCTDSSMDTLADLPVSWVRLPENRGKGHALLAGFNVALSDSDISCVCVVDSDGQHRPDEIPRLYNAFQESGADLVIGSRVFEGGHVPLRSRFGNKVTATITALLLRHRLPDTQSGFRLFSRPFLESIVESVEGGRYETEMEIIVKAIREGRSTVSVPISTIYETGNASSHFRKFHDSFLIYTRLLRAAWSSRPTE